jgi:hypothetical protein
VTCRTCGCVPGGAVAVPDGRFLRLIAPGYTALLRQDGGEGLSPPLEQRRLTAHVDPGSVMSGNVLPVRFHRSRITSPARDVTERWRPSSNDSKKT